MENSAPKKPIRKVTPAKRLPMVNIHQNYLGFYLTARVTKYVLDHRKITHSAPARKIAGGIKRTSNSSKMLDAMGLLIGEIKVIPVVGESVIRLRRVGDESFTIFVDEYFNDNKIQDGDFVEIHFRFTKKAFETASIRLKNNKERDDDFEFGEIISQTFKHLRDPIWQVGSELIEKALRVTNPDDPEYYGSSSGCLSFWSYRSYNAREEIYIQWRWNSVGELYVEAVSNKYAWPKISVDGINHLLDTGWSGPRDDSDEDLPNFFRTYEDVDVKKVAHHLMKVLRDVYLVKRDWIWLFNPFHLVEKLFEGKSEDDFQFKPEAFFIFDEKQTYKRRCEMGVQLSKDVLPPKWLRPWLS